MRLAPDGQNWVPIVGILLPLILGTVSASSLEQTSIAINGKIYRVELAQTPAQRRQGLMYRTNLADDHGMLLIYPQEGDYRIWMKNTRIALQVYWIDADFRVIHHQRLEPCETIICPSFAAPAQSRYILELNDSAHGIKPGDRVSGLSDL